MEKADFLDAFQSRFRPGLGIETTLVMLYGDWCQERDNRESVTLFVVHHLFSILSIIVFLWGVGLVGFYLWDVIH